MANYYEYSVVDVINPDMVGVGSGDAPDGSLRICVALEGEPINPGLREDPAALRRDAPLPGQDEEPSPEHYRTWADVNWRALTLEAAQALFEQLCMFRHLWEKSVARDEGSETSMTEVVIARWPIEPATPQDPHRQGLPCEFCDGRVADVEHQTAEHRHAIVHGVIVCRVCLPIVEAILNGCRRDNADER